MSLSLPLGYKTQSLYDLIFHTVTDHSRCLSSFHEDMSWIAVRAREAAAYGRYQENARRMQEQWFNAPPAACTRSHWYNPAGKRGKPPR